MPPARLARAAELRTSHSFWLRLLCTAGPGLVVMLADTDAGSVITIAQSGAQWGYRLLLPNLLLIPFMFIAQELSLRLGLGTGQGCAELVLRQIGRFPAMLLMAALVVSCFGGLVSQMSGLAGAGAALGMPVWVTVTTTVAGLLIMVVTGSYRSVERMALAIGLFELAFLVMFWRAAPDFTQVARQAAQQPLQDPGYLYLLAANLGTSILPWGLLYQQSASVDKGLRPAQIGMARLETLVGVVLCQGISSVLLITAGATLGGGIPLETVGQIETAFTATLGTSVGRLVFVLGLSGSALVAAIVVCLTLAWSFGGMLGVRHSLEHHPSQAPWFYGALALMLVAAGAVVASGVGLVRLSVAAGAVNAVLLPVILGFLYHLARTSLPEELRPRGPYAATAAIALLLVGGIGLYAGLVGAFR